MSIPFSPTQIKTIQHDLATILEDNIIPFWYPSTLDQEYGGYNYHHGVYGKYMGTSNKGLIAQTRSVWFYARLYNEGYKDPKYKDAATLGYSFLKDAMWDKEHGGFYWMVDHTGKNPINKIKHLYGQSFGLYALCEYAQAFDHSEAQKMADDLFHLFETKSYDAEHGGYIEVFQADWSQADEDTESPLHQPPGFKLMNTHLHLLESFTSYYERTKDQTARDRLKELITIINQTVVRKNIPACTDVYYRDWTPRHGTDFDRVSYGHDLEAIWLLAKAINLVGVSTDIYMQLFKALFDNCYRYGFDREQGGFYSSGPLAQPADNKNKTWWVQAEALICCLWMAQATGDRQYADCFTQTLQWVKNFQMDSKGKEWFSSILPDGTPALGKAGNWKTPYHNGRAMFECKQLLL